jgi:hypothetical protein
MQLAGHSSELDSETEKYPTTGTASLALHQ